MKNSILFALVALNIIACGEEKASAPAAQATPTPTVSPSPSPTPVVSASDSLVGNWISGTNTLDFSKDGTAKSNAQALNWSADANRLLLKANSIDVDNCSYEIFSAGGLVGSLVITLDLGCQKAGQLTYIRK